MSLLTKEQQTIFGNIRQAEANAFYNPEPGCGNQFMNARVAVIELLSIIDDLQARAPKQYTEQELREWFGNRPLVQDEIDALLHEVVPGENEAWYSVLKFAAHVGALKAEP